MLEEFLTYLMAISWSAGALTSDYIRNERGRKMLPSPREEELFYAFRDGRIYDVASALGRPYRWEFPAYLADELKEQGRYAELSKAENAWLSWSELGAMAYIAKKEGWEYKLFAFPEIRGEWLDARKEQEEFAAWYNEAKENYPSYALEQIYPDEYPTKEDYFKAIEQKRADNPDFEAIFGIPPESTDPQYDEKIKRLFYEIDPENKFGGLDFKYHIFQFYLPYGYSPRENGQPMKLYVALNRILRDAGLDQRALFKVYSGFLSECRDKVVELYRSAPPSKEHIQHVMAAIDDVMNGPDKELNRREIFIEGIKLMLRVDGYDPNEFMPRLPTQSEEAEIQAKSPRKRRWKLQKN